MALKSELVGKLNQRIEREIPQMSLASGAWNQAHDIKEKTEVEVDEI